MDISKIVKISAGLDKVFRILQRIALIAAIVMICVLGVLTVANAIDPSTVIGNDLNVIEIGPLRFVLDEAHTPDNATVLTAVWIMAVAAIAAVAALYYALGVVRRILAPMIQGAPFYPTVGQDIRKLAFAALALGVVQNVLNTVQTLYLLRVFDFAALLQNSPIRSVGVNFRYELGFIVAFFVLLLLSCIFQYGAALQKQSDETL